MITSTGGGPATQRVIYGTRDGFINLQVLATGAPVGPEAGVNVDDAPADLDVFGQRMTRASVSFADTSTAAGLGQVFAVHNDDDITPGTPDIEIAQIDEASGNRVDANGAAPGMDFDVAATDGLSIRSSVVTTGPATDDYAGEFFRWFAEESVRIEGRYAVAPNGAGRLLTMKQPVGPCLLITPSEMSWRLR